MQLLIYRFDEEKDLAGIFEEMWEENTSSASVALRLYASDIVPHLREGIASSSWPQKQKVLTLRVHQDCIFKSRA